MGICIRDMHTYTDFTARTAECHGKHDTRLSLDAYAAQFLCIKGKPQNTNGRSNGSLTERCSPVCLRIL